MECAEPQSTRYQYDALLEVLPFRILTLFSAPSFTSPLRCDLQTSLLVPGMLTSDYEALSYTWGDPHVTSVVLFPDNTNIPVTANLESFLRHQREKDSPVHLWVDALCINQEDILERNSQIERMSMIYASAAHLTVWLGPTYSDSDVAIQRLKIIAWTHPFEKLDMLEQRELTAIESLLSRAWWSRIWIVQELRYGVMGKKIDMGQVMCGRDQIPWANLVVACARLNMNKGNWRRGLAGSNLATVLELDALAQADAKAEESYRTTQKDEGMMKVLNTVVRFRGFQATDPKDKLYAMTSMLTGCISHEVSIPVTYELSKEVVYTHFAITTLRATEDLNFLRHNRSAATNDNVTSVHLPSWVPDWAANATEKPFPSKNIRERRIIPWWSLPSGSGPDGTTHYFKRHDYAAIRQCAKAILSMNGSSKTTTQSTSGFNVVLSERAGRFMSSRDYNARQVQDHFLRQFFDDETSAGPQYTAGGTKRSAFCIEEPLNYLKVNGILWDEIDIIHDSFVDDFDLNSTNSVRLRTAIALCKVTAVSEHTDRMSPYASGIDILKAFWTTIFAGQIVDNVGKELVNNWLPDAQFDWESVLPTMAVLDAATLELTQFALGRRFFITRNGYFGLGPQVARYGDRVVVLLGVDVPLVLRRLDKTHHVVGEAYVHGIMNGEAVEQWCLGMKEISKFVLS
jgi:hypothetical protein